MGHTARKIALTTAAAAMATGMAAAPASADVSPGDYSKYVTIKGPQSLVVGGASGVWTLQAKNPNSVADNSDHLLLNAYFVAGKKELRIEYRSGTSGRWAAAPVSWHQMSSDPARNPLFLGSLDFTGKALRLAPHSTRTFQIRVHQVASKSPTLSMPVNLSAYLTPAAGQSGQGGNWVAQADAWYMPKGLTTSITGLPTKLRADDKPHVFQVHVRSLNHAGWQIPRGSFFVYQGQKYGSMEGPKPCDAEIDVWDPTHHRWHKVAMSAAGYLDGTVDLTHWATGPAWNRTITARITLGAGFRTSAGAQISFGAYSGGEPTDFWTTQKLTATPVRGVTGCVKPA